MRELCEIFTPEKSSTKNVSIASGIRESFSDKPKGTMQPIVPQLVKKVFFLGLAPL